MDFPALAPTNGQTTTAKYAADNVQQSGSPYLPSGKDLLMFKSSSSIPTRGATDFASAVRKLASQDSGIWKYDRNGSGDASTGSSRSLNVLASAYNGGQGRNNFGDRLQNRGSARPAPVWLETGDAVGKYLCLYVSIFRRVPFILVPFNYFEWQQICILNFGRRLVIMHAYVMHILSRWVSDSCCREVNEHFNDNSVMIFATHFMVD